MVSVVAVTARLAALVGWKSESVPPLRVIVAAPKGVPVFAANTPPPLMETAVIVEAPAVSSSVPRPVLIKVPVLIPEVVSVAPAATSSAPLAVKVRARAVAKELVISKAAGADALELFSVTAPLATVSPSCALLLTLNTPPNTEVAATGLRPLRIIVPIPLFCKIP